jgi:CRP/FNR family transcriptional regulator, cyclic AMP receptor protein
MSVSVRKYLLAMAEQIWSIQHCRLFEKLAADDLEFLEQRSRMKTFARSSAIYLPKDMAESVLVVVSGRIRLYSVTPDGKEVLLAFVDPGELFGELALTGSEIREEFAQAAAPSTVVAIPKDAMETVLLRNAGLSLSITRYVGLRRRSLERRLKNLMFRSNRERLLGLLRELLEQYGRPVVEGILIDIRLSHQDLASLIGITRESVTLTLGELQNERMISIGRQRIVVLDRQRLIQAAGL